MTDAEPRWDIAESALDLVRELEHPAIANHSIRTFLHAQLAAETLPESERPDPTVLFVACLFHDAGTADAHDGAERFEVAGADAAAAFLRERGFDAATIDTVWEAIALHTSPGIAERRGPVTRLVRLGVSADFGDESYPGAGEARSGMERAYPRLDIEKVLSKAVLGQALRDPGKAPGSSWAGRLLHEHLAHPFADDAVNPAF